MCNDYVFLLFLYSKSSEQGLTKEARQSIWELTMPNNENRHLKFYIRIYGIVSLMYLSVEVFVFETWANKCTSPSLPLAESLIFLHWWKYCAG